MSYFFKVLVGFILASGVTDADGWVAVEKVPNAKELVTDLDPSIWVLFSKTLGAEKFLVRFPKDPVYRTVEGGGVILRAHFQGEIFELTAQKGSDQPKTDLSYEFEGKWIHEHFVETEEHLYRLRTYSPFSESQSHTTFATSFQIQ